MRSNAAILYRVTIFKNTVQIAKKEVRITRAIHSMTYWMRLLTPQGTTKIKSLREVVLTVDFICVRRGRAGAVICTDSFMLVHGISEYVIFFAEAIFRGFYAATYQTSHFKVILSCTADF